MDGLDGFILNHSRDIANSECGKPIHGLYGPLGGLGLIVIIWLGICSIVYRSFVGFVLISIVASVLEGLQSYDQHHRLRLRASELNENSGIHNLSVIHCPNMINIDRLIRWYKVILL